MPKALGIGVGAILVLFSGKFAWQKIAAPKVVVTESVKH
jgi:hypothetical protein